MEKFESLRGQDPHSPLLTAYEAGAAYALAGRPCPAGATAECRQGYYDADAWIVDAEVANGAY